MTLREHLRRSSRFALKAGRALGLVFIAVIRALGGAAQAAGVGVGTWAAWGYDPQAGKVVLAVGLLILGGVVQRLATEVRSGAR